jgi:membrane-bound metal-dependent hydrolase YbcI (DUF457 family)
MMTGKTHLLITGATVYLTKGLLPLSSSFALGCFIGSLLPDCDYRKSPIGKILPIWLISKHRGFTHSYFICTAVSVFAVLSVGYGFGIGLLIGYALHLLADSLTKMSLPYKWFPFKYRHIK